MLRNAKFTTILLTVCIALLASCSVSASTEFATAASYRVPPQGHYNTFATNFLDLGQMSRDLIEMPLALYYWEADDWMKLGAADWELLAEENTYRVYLREGVKWHDGSQLTSKDVLATFHLGHLMNWAVWNYVDSVDAVDEYTVDFHMHRPASVVLRYILRERIRPYSVYGEYYERLLALTDAGKDLESSEVKQLKVEFSQFRPRTIIGTGPYTIEPHDVTEAVVVLRRFADYWDPESIKFDKVTVYNGETLVTTPLVMAKEVDFTQNVYPPATEQRFEEMGLSSPRSPYYWGAGLYFNHDVYPLNRKEVRQAIAYAVDREEATYVSVRKSGYPQEKMTGMSDRFIPLWLDEEERVKLNPYSHDLAKAAALLESIGFEKNSAGKWLDDNGKPMKYELVVPAEYLDWAASAMNIASQLSDFGIDVSVRGVTHSQVPQEIWSGRFEMVVFSWGTANPHPHFSYYQNLVSYNYPQGQGPGMNFPLVQETDEFGTVDLFDMVNATADGLDEEAQRATVAKLALIFNDLLPVIPMYEGSYNCPTIDGVRANFPAHDHPVWKNGGGDFPPMVFLYEGAIEPVK
ncbi:MAG: ABC transporter substrate-binding protein [Firmicutes bacterium]|nr:ABC transporter substrate-binding protein [Bacillota bacterium]